MKQFVVKLKDLNKFDLELEGDIEEVLADTRALAEQTAQDLLAKEAYRIKEAKQLGEDFANKIN